MKILFIDDEVLMLKGLERSFKKFKDEVAVFTSNTVQDAYEIIKNKQIDCVVSDLNVLVHLKVRN